MASNESIFSNKFIEISALGFGGFSTIFMCEHKLEKNVYAIKKICFKSENKDNVTKELTLLSQLKCEFFVKYVDSWIESNYYIGSHNSENLKNISSDNLLYSQNMPQLLHIQMELCSLTLRDVINIITKECITSDQSLSVIGYYISSELYSEILECVQYLHKQNPQIIHRDLKPENILLTNFVNNRFVKLSDFGLSTFHEFADQSHTKYTGTKNYRAYELNFSKKYSPKVDIYSLGIILQELFRIDINNSKRRNLPELEPKMSYLVNLIQKQLAFIPSDRPNCDEMLLEKDKWLTTDQILLGDENFKKLITNSPNLNLKIENNFIEFYVQNKYNSKSQLTYKRMAQTNNLSINESHKPLLTLSTSSISPTNSKQPIRSLTDTNTVDTGDDDYEYYRVSLSRSNTGFGLKVVGGSEESRNVTISSIVIGSVAHINGVLRVNDEIVSINDRNVNGLRHHEVVRLISQSGSFVTIYVRRKRYATLI